MRDSGERAEMLLYHIGHGNLPFAAGWNTRQRAAFEDLAHEQVLDPASAEEATHVVFRVRLQPGRRFRGTT